jgi:hypothetical protein
VEANDRVREKVVASGVDPADVFGYPAAFAWANYADVCRRFQETGDIRGVFPYFRDKSRYRIQDSREGAPGPGWRLVGGDEYGTLVGRKGIAVWMSPRPRDPRTARWTEPGS